MKGFKKLLFAAAAALTICSFAALSSQDSIYAAEYEVDADVPINDDFANYYNGDVKALIVRVGFSDYPVDESNPVYNKLSDEYLYSLYEGKEEGSELPYNGLSDFLKKSSYGKMNMSVGDIIDIQLSGTLDSYLEEGGGTIGFYDNGSYFEEDGEFCGQLFKQIDLADYDYNINALYIWSVAGQSFGEADGYTVPMSVWNADRGSFKTYAVMCPPEDELDNFAYISNILIHETGHLIGGIDYYELDTYPLGFRVDTGNIMGWASINERGDYDAWTKWVQKWLSKENVTGIALENGETGRVYLTPYDSDTDEGKKIALFKYSDGYIAADYTGGINNNAYSDTSGKGFRFYKIDKDADIKEVVHSLLGTDDTYSLNVYQQLFVESDEIDDLLYENESETFKITDIETGDNPSFAYSYTKEQAAQTDSTPKQVRYNVRFVDEEGNMPDMNEIELKLNSYSDDLYFYSNKNDDFEEFCSYGELDENFGFDTTLSVTGIPDGYKDVRGLINLNQRGSDLTSDSAYVKSIEKDPLWEGSYYITIQLQKGARDIKYAIYTFGDDEKFLTFQSFYKYYPVGSVEGYQGNSGNGYHVFEEFSENANFDTTVKLEQCPEGYKAIPDITLSQRGETLTSDSEYVTNIYNESETTYAIVVTLSSETEDPGTEEPVPEPENPGNEEPVPEPEDPGTEEPATEPEDPGTEEPATEPEDPGAEGPVTEPEDPGAEGPVTEPEDPDDEEPVTELKKSDANDPGTEAADLSKANIDKSPTRETAPDATKSDDYSDNKDVKKLSSGNEENTYKAMRIPAAAEVGTGSADKGYKVPETGDKYNAPVWLTLAGASAGVICTALIARKKKKTKDL